MQDYDQVVYTHNFFSCYFLFSASFTDIRIMCKVFCAVSTVQRSTTVAVLCLLAEPNPTPVQMVNHLYRKMNFCAKCRNYAACHLVHTEHTHTHTLRCCCICTHTHTHTTHMSILVITQNHEIIINDDASETLQGTIAAARHCSCAQLVMMNVVHVCCTEHMCATHLSPNSNQLNHKSCVEDQQMVHGSCYRFWAGWLTIYMHTTEIFLKTVNVMQVR